MTIHLRLSDLLKRRILWSIRYVPRDRFNTHAHVAQNATGGAKGDRLNEPAAISGRRREVRLRRLLALSGRNPAGASTQ